MACTKSQHQSISSFHHDMKDLYESFGLNGEGANLLAEMEKFIESGKQLPIEALKTLSALIEEEEKKHVASGNETSQQGDATKTAQPHGRSTRSTASKSRGRKRSVSSHQDSRAYLKWLFLYKHFLRALERHGMFVRSESLAIDDQSEEPQNCSLDSLTLLAKLNGENDELQSELFHLRQQFAALKNELRSVCDRLADAERRLADAEEKLSFLPTRDEIALYDVVYAFITDVKRLTGNKYVRIEDIADPNFTHKYRGADALLTAIDNTFGTDGRQMFLQVTRRIADMHGTTGHLSTEERVRIYSYQRLLGLCDDEQTRNLLEVLRSIPGRDRNWPLAPVSTQSN